MSHLNLPPTQPGFVQPPQPPSRGRATASLILGICSLFLWLCPLFGVAASVTGLVLGLQGRKRGEGGMATAGVILSILGLLF